MKTTKKNQVRVSKTPIVVFLGHVDHGKTTLLDSIRKTNVVDSERGGITQSTVASKVTFDKGKSITFIDTPGHAAFSNMRSRGVQVADLAILIVASDDGIKPQTKEALEYIRSVKMPFIVVATKSDLPSASKETIVNQFESEGVLLEGKGGDIPIMEVSAKKNQGINELVEMIFLVFEMTKKKSADGFSAFVLETKKDKKGLLVLAIIKTGKLEVGDVIYTEGKEIKIKSLFDEKGNKIKVSMAGDPVSILGFSELPSVGSKLSSENNIYKTPKKNVLPRDDEKFSPIIKAKTSGSLEAVLSNISKEVNVVFSSVGDVTDADVFLAKSLKNPVILAFESKVSGSVTKLAKAEDVKIFVFDIIYELFKKLDELVLGKMDRVLGKATILASFPFNKEKVAGGTVSKGRIANDDNVIVMRDDKEIGEATITSLKRERKIIDIAKPGEEFGAIFSPQLDFEPNDVIISVAK